MFPSDKTIFPGGENLDHQAALSSRSALSALITGPCVGEKEGGEKKTKSMRIQAAPELSTSNFYLKQFA